MGIVCKNFTRGDIRIDVRKILDAPILPPKSIKMNLTGVNQINRQNKKIKYFPSHLNIRPADYRYVEDQVEKKNGMPVVDIPFFLTCYANVDD